MTSNQSRAAFSIASLQAQYFAALTLTLCRALTCRSDEEYSGLGALTDGLVQRVRIALAARIVVAARAGEAHRGELTD